jgi:hypothetical protein
MTVVYRTLRIKHLAEAQAQHSPLARLFADQMAG